MKYSVNNRTNTEQEGVILCAKVNNLCGGYLMQGMVRVKFN
jgi:hypothetical protein